MKYYTIQPPTELADYIQFFWVLEGSSSPRNPFFHRALADSCPELIFYYKGQFKILSSCATKPAEVFRSGVYGQSREYKTFMAKSDFGIFGVYLYPYAIPQLFSLPACELSGHSIDLASLCGEEGIVLEEKVILAANNFQRAKLVSGFIKNRLRQSRATDLDVLHHIKHLTNAKDPASILSLAKDCNLSRRQFERKFKGYAGFSPKVFLNLLRFNSVIKAKKPTNNSLTGMAIDYGYFDQSHFIHDFKAFSGYTPKEYFNQKLEDADYRTAVEFKL